MFRVMVRLLRTATPVWLKSAWAPAPLAMTLPSYVAAAPQFAVEATEFQTPSAAWSEDVAMASVAVRIRMVVFMVINFEAS